MIFKKNYIEYRCGETSDEFCTERIVQSYKQWFVISVKYDTVTYFAERMPIP